MLYIVYKSFALNPVGASGFLSGRKKRIKQDNPIYGEIDVSPPPPPQPSSILNPKPTTQAGPAQVPAIIGSSIGSPIGSGPMALLERGTSDLTAPIERH